MAIGRVAWLGLALAVLLIPAPFVNACLPDNASVIESYQTFSWRDPNFLYTDLGTQAYRVSLETGNLTPVVSIPPKPLQVYYNLASPDYRSRIQGSYVPPMRDCGGDIRLTGWILQHSVDGAAQTLRTWGTVYRDQIPYPPEFNGMAWAWVGHAAVVDFGMRTVSVVTWSDPPVTRDSPLPDGFPSSYTMLRETRGSLFFLAEPHAIVFRFQPETGNLEAIPWPSGLEWPDVGSMRLQVEEPGTTMILGDGTSFRVAVLQRGTSIPSAKLYDRGHWNWTWGGHDDSDGRLKWTGYGVAADNMTAAWAYTREGRYDLPLEAGERVGRLEVGPDGRVAVLTVRHQDFGAGPVSALPSRLILLDAALNNSVAFSFPSLPIEVVDVPSSSSSEPTLSSSSSPTATATTPDASLALLVLGVLAAGLSRARRRRGSAAVPESRRR